MHIPTSHLRCLLIVLYTTLTLAHPKPILDFTPARNQQPLVRPPFPLRPTSNPLPPVQITTSPFSSPPPLDPGHHTGPISGTLDMHSTLSHHIPLSFTLKPTTCHPPPTIHLLSTLASQLRTASLDLTPFPVSLSQSMEHRMYQLTFSLSLTPVEREDGGIRKEQLGFLVRLIERSVQVLEEAVTQRGVKGLGSVQLEGEVEGVVVRGRWEVGEIVDGKVMSCER